MRWTKSVRYTPSIDSTSRYSAYQHVRYQLILLSIFYVIFEAASPVLHCILWWRIRFPNCSKVSKNKADVYCENSSCGQKKGETVSQACSLQLFMYHYGHCRGLVLSITSVIVSPRETYANQPKYLMHDNLVECFVLINYYYTFHQHIWLTSEMEDSSIIWLKRSK